MGYFTLRYVRAERHNIMMHSDGERLLPKESSEDYDDYDDTMGTSDSDLSDEDLDTFDWFVPQVI